MRQLLPTAALIVCNVLSITNNMFGAAPALFIRGIIKYLWAKPASRVPPKRTSGQALAGQFERTCVTSAWNYEYKHKHERFKGSHRTVY